MVEFLALQVIMEHIAIDQVPEKFRDLVKARLVVVK